MPNEDEEVAHSLLANRIGALEILLQNLYVRYLTEQRADGLSEVKRSFKRLKEDSIYILSGGKLSSPEPATSTQNLLIDFFGHVISIVESMDHHKQTMRHMEPPLNTQIATALVKRAMPNFAHCEVEQVDFVEAASDAVYRLWLKDQNEPSVPKSIILKQRGSNSLRNHMVDTYRLFDREVFFYQHLAKASSIGAPGCLYASASEQILILQDFGQFVTGDQEAGYEPLEALSVMRQMAQFHLKSVELQKEHSLPLPKINDSSALSVLPGMLEQIWGGVGTLLSSNTPMADKIVKRLIKDIPDIANNLSKDHLAVIHGDLRLENLLFEGMEMKIVLDWQLVSLGSPMLDVAYFMTQSGNKDSRVRVEAEILKIYSDAFKPLGYTESRIKSEYQNGIFYSLIIPIFGAASDLQQGKPIRPLVLNAFNRALEALDEQVN